MNHITRIVVVSSLADLSGVVGSNVRPYHKALVSQRKSFGYTFPVHEVALCGLEIAGGWAPAALINPVGFSGQTGWLPLGELLAAGSSASHLRCSGLFVIRLGRPEAGPMPADVLIDEVISKSIKLQRSMVGEQSHLVVSSNDEVASVLAVGCAPSDMTSVVLPIDWKNLELDCQRARIPAPTLAAFHTRLAT